MSERTGGRRLLARVYVLAVFALLVFAALGLLAGDVRRTAVASLALLLVMRGPGGGLIAFTGCLILGEWAPAGAAAASALSGRLDLMLFLRRRKLDPSALTAAVAALPEPLHGQLRSRAGRNPITTWHVVDLARSENPAAWRTVLQDDPGGNGFDGLIVADPYGGTCSQFIAEAAAFGTEIARHLGRMIDAEVLAVAACLMMHSLADEWLVGNPVESILQMSEVQLLESFRTFHRTSAASGFAVRTERALALPDGVAAHFTSEQLASLTRAQLVQSQIVYRGLNVVATGAVLVSAVGSLLKPLSGRRDRAQDMHPDVPPSPAPPSSTPATWRGRSMPRPLAAWNGLSLTVRAIWLAARPALALAAITTAAIVDHAPWWAIALVVSTVLLLRSLRSPLPSAFAAAVIAPLAPAASSVLVIRIVVGEAGLLAARTGSGFHRRAAGMARIIEARRRLVAIDAECASYADAHLRFERLVARPAVDDDDLFSSAAVQLLAAWSEARPLDVAHSALGLLKGGIFGRWDGRSAPVDFGGELRRMFIREMVGGAAVRVGLVLLAAAVATLVVGPVPWALGDHGAVALLPPAAGALAIVIPASRTRPALLLTAIGAGAVWILLPDQALSIVGISAASTIAANLLRKSLQRATLKGPGEEPWAPLRDAPARSRELWLAADEAARSGRVPLATEMLDELARKEAKSHPQFAGECQARIALWQLDEGRLGDAAARLDRIAPTSVDGVGSRFSRMSAAGNYAVGMLSFHLGDDVASRDQLVVALDQAAERPTLARRIALSLAETHARLDEAEAALRVLEANPLPAVGSAGMAMIIDREVVAALALDRAGDHTSALERIKRLTGVNFVDKVDFTKFGEETVMRIGSAEGRANLLGGRLQLESGNPIEARPLLANAVKLLSHDTDAYLRAGAEILHGRSLTAESRHDEAVTAVRKGLEILEDRRLQLSSAERRTAMIVAGESIYEHALATFERADRSGHASAGLLAFALIESLRRSAISGMLRRPRDEFRDEINEALKDLDDTREDSANDSKAQAQLARLVSTQFADAFLPSRVDPRELQAAARRNGHILAFYVAPTGGSTWRGWMSPDGKAQIREVGAAHDARHPLGRLREGPGFTEPELHGPWDDCGAVWRELAEALLPPDLTRLLPESEEHWPIRILIVPDGYLAGIPWGALSINGTPLVKHALMQVVPTVDLAGTTPRRPRRPNSTVVTFAKPNAVRLLGKTLALTVASDREAFVATLDADSCGGAYIGTHGESTGLDQRVQFGDREWLSAAGALMHPWPDWVIFAACVVGQIDPRAGGEPLGLPISCMLGGSTSVIAAVVRITGDRADATLPVTTELFAQVGRRLSDGAPAAEALRAAQLTYLSSSGDMASVGDGLGAVCLSTRALSSAGLA